MDFHFLRPYYLLFIILAFILVFLLFKKIRKINPWEKVIDPILLPILFPHSKNRLNWHLAILFFLAWSIAIFALAGPTWKMRQQSIYRNTTSKIILLDLSPSMLATDIQPNRLERAKYKILDLLQNHSEGQIGLIVFSKEAYTVSPLTYDAHTISLMVPELPPDIMPVEGNNINAGLEQAEKLLKQGHAINGSILLISASQPTSSTNSIVQKIHAEGYKVSVLAIINASQLVINNQDKSIILKLENLAKIGGGRFTTFTDDNQDLQYLTNTNSGSHKSFKVEKNNSKIFWHDEGRWFILLILPFVLLYFRYSREGIF